MPAWFFGGLNVTGWCWIGAAAGLALALLSGPRAGMPTPRTVWLLLVPLGFAAIGAAQLLPLPGVLRAKASPRAHSWWTTAAQVLPPEDAAQTASCLSLYPAGTRMAVALALLSAAALFVGSQFLRTSAALRWWFVALALMGSATALVGITFLNRPSDRIYGTLALTAGGKPFAGFVTRNHAGALLNMCFAGALAWTLRSWTRSRGSQPAASWERGQRQPAPAGEPDRLLAALALGVTGLGVLACLSRGAWVGAAAGGVAAGVAHLVSRRRAGGSGRFSASTSWLAFAGSVGVAVALVALSGLDGQIAERASNTNDSRVKHWRQMLPALGQFGLTGSGLGTYAHLSPLYTPDADTKIYEHAENTYLEIVVEAGWFGLALAACGLALAVRAWWLVARRDEQRDGWALAVAGGYVIASQAVQSAVDFALYLPANLLLLSLWLGALAGRAARVQDEAPKARPFAALLRSPWAARLVAAGLLAGAAWAGPEAGRRERVEWALRDERAKGFDLRPTREMVEDSVRRLTDLVAAVPDDGVLREALAKRLVHRFRLADLDEAPAPVPAELRPQAFGLTDLGPVNVRVRGRLLRSDRLRLREPRQVQESLLPACAAARSALARAPLLREPPLLLAEAAWTDDAAEAFEAGWLDRAARLAPGSSEAHYRRGLCHYAHERRDATAEAWRSSLQISVAWQRAILAIAGEWFQPEDLLDRVVPPEAGKYLDVAREWEGRPDLRGARQLAARRALDMVRIANEPTAVSERHAGEARLILDEKNPDSKELAVAIAELSRHIARKPDDADARMLVSRAYKRLATREYGTVDPGKLDEAIMHAELAKNYGGGAPRFVENLDALLALRKKTAPRR